MWLRLVVLLSTGSALVLKGKRSSLLVRNGALSVADVSSLKADVYRLSEGTSNGVKASEHVRASGLEAVVALEGTNPSRAPAKSAMLDGTWKLVYTTTRGGSTGM